MDDKKLVIVVAAGKGRTQNPQLADKIDHWPAKFKVGGTLEEIILVGASDKNGRRLLDSPANVAIDTFAPGGSR